MASENLLIDTSGFFAVLNAKEACHKQALDLFKTRAEKFVLITTEYVVMETASLLRARGAPGSDRKFFALLDATTRIRVVWSSSTFFTKTRDYFLKHHDHGYSFADCASFVLMEAEGLRESLSTDKHFQQAGFTPLLQA